MNFYRIFIASSFRLAHERNALETEIGRLNDEFSKRHVYLKVDIWEKFDAANDSLRKQNFYNEHIAKADLFLVIYQDELGAFTREEYRHAQELFTETGRPRLYLFKKTGAPDQESLPVNVQNLAELEALWYTKDEEQWPWEFENKDALVKKVADDIRALFSNPDLPYFSFPEVKKLSLNSPEMPVGFLGREEEMKTIYEKLNSGGKLMLINAEGGIGKTTLAAKYWNEALNKYKHAAWLFCEGGIVNSLKELAPQLNIDMSGMDEQQQIQAMKQGLAAVQNDFLLVLDNANNEEDIRLFRQEFEGFHWHVLITSRCQGVLDKEYELAINHLPPPLAKEVFERYYREDTADFNELLDRVLMAINYHTLLTEVFAKNLAEAAELGEMDLDVFLNTLENEGLYLREQSFEVDNNEWAAKRKAATTDQILDALYDFGQLTEEQRFLMVNLSLLPAEPYTLVFINSLLVKEPERTARQLRDTLKVLVKKGWISENGRSYRLSPVIQKLVAEKHRETLGENSKDLLERLNYITEADAYNLMRTSLKEATPYIRPVLHLTKCLNAHPRIGVALYNSFSGIYFINTGDTLNALQTFVNYKKICISLLEKDPKNSFLKSSLAISYEKLGGIYELTGDWRNALKNYQESKRIHLENCDTPEYKHGLAIVFSRLASIYQKSGDWSQALQNYQESSKIERELVEENYENLNYHNGLAVSYEKIGNLFKEIGDNKKAMENYINSLSISKEISEKSPQNLEYKHGLAISYQNLGMTYSAMNEWQQALHNYEQYNKLEKEIYEVSPENLPYKNALAISYSKLGSVYLKTGNIAKSLYSFMKYNLLELEIAEISPDIIEYKEHLAISFEKLGDIYFEIKESEKALYSFQESLRLTNEIYTFNNENLDYKNGLAIAYYKLGIYYINVDKKLAIANINRSLELYEELVEKASGRIEFSNNYNYIKNYLEELKP